MKRQVIDWRDVIALVASCRNDGLVATNFFPDEMRMSAWCRGGAFFEEHCGDTQFFVRKQTGFCNLYFMSKSPDAIVVDLRRFLSVNDKGRWVTDLIGPDAARQQLEKAFASHGFSPLTTLQRMGRRTPMEDFSQQPDVECANSEDAANIKSLLDKYFVAEEEQLPDIDEIQGWIDTGTLYLVRGDQSNSILGFTIFDLTPAALYLRYWFVHPDSRGNGIGGRLMKAMFATGHGTKRQYFWVKTDNENAIKCYQHYGFQFEPMKDVVMACNSLLVNS